jgi:hypothetical protein
MMARTPKMARVTKRRGSPRGVIEDHGQRNEVDGAVGNVEELAGEREHVERGGEDGEQQDGLQGAVEQVDDEVVDFGLGAGGEPAEPPEHVAVDDPGGKRQDGDLRRMLPPGKRTQVMQPAVQHCFLLRFRACSR